MKNIKIFARLAVISVLYSSKIYSHELLYFPLVPASEQLKANVEEGFNYDLGLGYVLGRGKARDNFLGVGPWEAGWVGSTPEIELGLNYGFNEKFKIGIQIPSSLISSNVFAHYSFNPYLGVGAKLGVLSSLYAVITAQSDNGLFVSLTPSIQLVEFGNPSKAELNESEFLQPTVMKSYSQSRYLMQVQASFGIHHDPFDAALYVAYAHAPGNGIYNFGIFEDILLRDFVRAGLKWEF